MADYNEFLYDDFPFMETHPSITGVVGCLFGMHPAPPDKCRVLELGCGLGGNLIGIAANHPESSFVGLDLSARQVERGRVNLVKLGLKNVDLRAMDIREVDRRLGQFDYVICHGVYSWVGPDVQVAILRIMRDLLAPDGIGYVSYNTLPGWHLRGGIRAMLHERIPAEGSPQERAARAREFIEFLVENIPDGGTATTWFSGELETILKLSDRYLFYEYLVERNEPVLFQEFASRAWSAGLQYLGDADFASMLPQHYGPKVSEVIGHWASGMVQVEQHLDYLSMRYFRRSLLCHRETPLDREVGPERLADMWITSKLVPPEDVSLEKGEEVTMETPRGLKVTSDDPVVKAAHSVLSEGPGAGYQLPELEALVAEQVGGFEDGDRERVGEAMLDGFVHGYVKLHRWKRPFLRHVPPYPKTTPLVRLQAVSERKGVTTLRHESIYMDTLDRVLLENMDGTRDHEALLDKVMEAVDSGRLVATVSEEPLEAREDFAALMQQKLETMVKAALLIP